MRSEYKWLPSAKLAQGPIKRREPLLGLFPDYSKAFYVDPPSHDFGTFVVIAELMRRYHKAPAPLKITLLFQDGLLGKYHYADMGIKSEKAYPGINLEYSNSMVPHIVRPAIKMIGAVNSPDMHAPILWEDIADMVEYSYHIGPLVDAAKQGHEVPCWQIQQWATDEVREFLKATVDGRKPITITLRETGNQPERNSQTLEWIKFAEYVLPRYPVLFVRDTNMMHFPLGQLKTYPLASSNAYIRAALYHEAFCNLFVENGCYTWTLFSKTAPWISFKQIIPALAGKWAHGHRQAWIDYNHLDIGDQYPWSTPLQRLAWKDDTFENIRDEFEQFVRVSANSNQAA